MHPGNGFLVSFWLSNVGLLPTLYQTEGIPDLVTECGTLLAEVFLEENVVTGRSGQQHTHTYAICSVLLDKTNGVGAVAKTLGHLTANLIAYDTCEIYVTERNVLQIFLTGHNHTGYPEEDDIRTCYKVAGGVVVLNLLVAGIVDAVKQRYGPKPAGEPSVKGILVL